MSAVMELLQQTDTPERRPLTDLLVDPEHIEAVEKQSAKDLRDEISYALNEHTRVRKLDEETFEHHFDASLPTLAFDREHVFAGAELLGVANDLDTEKKFNIVYLNTATANMRVHRSDIGNRLQAERGSIVTASGTVLYGDFPSPITVDTFETVDVELLHTLRSFGIPTLSDPDTMSTFNDKQTLPEIGDQSGIVTPTRLATNDLVETSNVVIKPSKESQGRGVYFSTVHGTDPVEWKKYHTFLDNHGYVPVIEERIECWPLHAKSTGKQIDWNVRAIVSHGQFIDMYVRAGEIDSAINKSTGASTIPMNKFYQLLDKKSDPSARIMTKVLENAATDFAEQHPAFMVGLDLTIDKNGQVTLFEANAGHVGGLQTIAHNSDGTRTSKLRNACQMLALAAPHVSETAYEPNDTVPENVMTTYEAKVSFAESIGKTISLASEISSHEDTSKTARFALLKIAIAQANKASYLGYFYKDPGTAINDLLSTYPLELKGHVRSIDNNLLGSTAVSQAIESYLDADPLSEDWQVLAGYAAASSGDIKKFLAIHKDLSNKGMRRHTRLMMSGFTQHICQGLVPHDKKDEEEAHVEEAVYLFVRLLAEHYDAANTSKIIELGDEIITKGKNEKVQNYIRSAITNIFVCMDDYVLAAQYADQIDYDDVASSDYLSDMASENFSKMMTSDEGIKFYLDQMREFNAAAIVIDHFSYTKEPCSDIVIEQLVDYYKGDYTGQQVAYFAKMLRTALQKTDEYEVLPSEHSGLELFGSMIVMRASQLATWQLTYPLQRRIKELDPELTSDVDFLTDTWISADDIK